ncbi:MAG: hypothetical protein RIQ81_2337 [Pseudomonadota bacterium]
MKQRHLFIIDPLEELNLKLDSSLRMARSLARRGHRVFFATLRDLSWRSGKTAAWARCVEATFASDQVQPRLESKIPHSLAEFQGIHMRKDPPFDLPYIETTWLLDSVAGRVKIYNEPAALRRFNEKLSILLFPDAIRPALVSSDCHEIIEFIGRECHGDAVIKPLALFGGRGVERIELERDKDPARVVEKITAMTRDGVEKRIVQPFDPRVFDGEVRAFCVGGEPVAWCLKRPGRGEFLANTRAGATLESYKPTLDDLARVKNVAARLALEGAPIVGFDLIGGFISEINLTSPRLLMPAGQESAELQAYDHFAHWVERDADHPSSPK